MNELERLTPQNLEAEQSLLGSFLLDKDALVKVADFVKSEDFYDDKHRVIYEAILDLYRKHEPVDLLSLGNLLDERSHLERVGGRTYLVHLSNAVPTASHVENYANIVTKKSTLRKLIKAASDITAMGYDQAEQLQEVLDLAEQKLFAVSQNYLKSAFTPLKEMLGTAFDRIDELHRDAGKLRGTPTGFADLDKLLGGLQKSDLIILAARPSCGKTSLALDIARTAASKHQQKVGLFSLEMSKEQLTDRMICAEANVNLWSLRNGRLSSQGTNDDFSRIGHALGTLSEAPIYIDDTASLNVMEIRTKARRLQMDHGLDMLVIDYLQLMEGRAGGGNNDNRTQEIAQITRGLKSIARELNIPVIALSQLSRQVELTKPAIPKLAHLRESGSIEQDADLVMFIYRKAADKNYRLDDLSPEERNTAEIHIAKHRNGPQGIVRLFFDESRATFRNLERRMGAPQGQPAMAGGPETGALPPGPGQNPQGTPS
ncbi:replicative DNA helicase [Candidatus Uhrbacteria bacterium]|nr:replicative DNA helicase [Candidatus Uhrbacteria bacterium]MBD3283937.1 replicative DNA helicase [Candidatus Uhrbacteria bacterium]